MVFGGHDYLQRTTGLTYADYVHQGFGQLTVATALTLLVIWAAARKAPRATSEDRRWLRGSLGLLCLQTLVVVGSALHRMSLYQDAYGFTRLRLLVDVFEGWLGCWCWPRSWAASGCGPPGCRASRCVSGSVALLGLAAVNPDAWIASHNLDRYAETGRVDLDLPARPLRRRHPHARRARRPRPLRAARPRGRRRRLAGVEPRPRPCPGRAGLAHGSGHVGEHLPHVAVARQCCWPGSRRLIGLACWHEHDRLAARGRSGDPLAGAARPDGRVARRGGGRASAGGARGLGCAAAGAAGPRRAVGGRRLLPGACDRRRAGQPWTATMHSLQTLQLLGLDPATESARRAIALVAENGRWEHDGQPYFEGEVEPCINGRTIETGAYFGVDVERDRRAHPQRAARRRRLELRGRERLGPVLVRHDDQRARRAARVRARDRRLRRGARGPAAAARSTCSSAACSGAGAPARSPTRRTSSSPSPTTGTTTCSARSTTSAPRAVTPDPRLAEAIELVRSKQEPDGRWLLDRLHPGQVHFDLEGDVGAPEPVEHPPGAAGARLVVQRSLTHTATPISMKPMVEELEADYLVVGAGAMGMAFADALIDHADVTRGAGRPPARRRRALARRPIPSSACTRRPPSTASPRPRSAAADSRSDGPEAGLQERATAPEICAYYGRVLPTGWWRRAGSSSSPAASTSATARFVSRVSGERFEVPERCRIVDARYLVPEHPRGDAAAVRRRRRRPGDARSTTSRGSRRRPSQYVVVGSGKTATDACIWLLDHGVDPDAICWVRPRDPWMLNRAVVQPDPAIFLGMAADIDAGRGRGVVARRPVPPARGRRGHAAHRPLGHAHHGQGSDARRSGSSTSCARSRTSYGRGHIEARRAAAGSTSADGSGRGGATTPWSCTAPPTA